MRPELDETATAPPPGGAAQPSRAAPGAVTPGQQLGHFRIERPLGAGGMGEVYLATDLALDRKVAIKVLPAHVAGDAIRRDRMVREARAQAQVSHPNVGHIYFIGEHEQLLYFAMEYVAGETLGERIAKAPLSVDAALATIRAAALGLREAHRSGFTHRDVKPSNLMIDGHGVVKVLDFGLAASDLHAAVADAPVAQTSIAGTPLYMAPEQARGEPIDFRADIYALGATLYHLVSGNPPFVAETVDELLSLHATAARPALPKGARTRTDSAAIDALCARMMAPLAADRFTSYDELLRAVELASAAHTRPAGLTTRSLALGVDFLLATLVVGIADGGLGLVTGYEFTNGTAPVVTVLAVYVAVFGARWGTTLGKLLFELELVEVATGTRPTWKTSAIRSAAMFTVPVALAWIVELLRALGNGPQLVRQVLGVVTLAWFLICGILLARAALRVPGKRAPWDVIAGTVVRYRARTTAL